MSIATKNLQDFANIANEVQFKRDVQPLVNFLVETDFFIAPASTNHHENSQGGLYLHSKRVYNVLLHLNQLLDKKYTKETLFYCAFCHDLCKVNYYEKAKKWRKNEEDKWENYIGYNVVDKFPVGHGAKSIIIANRYVQLTEEEMIAIAHHMGAFMAIDSYSGMIYNDARVFSPLTTMLHAADMLAVDVITKNNE